MTSSRRVTFALAVLAAVFVAASGYAVMTLLAAGNVLLAGVAVLAGIACLGATALTWWLARELDGEAVPDSAPPVRAVAEERPVKIQALPEVELPPAYLAAVRKGAQAHREAWKARATQY